MKIREFITGEYDIDTCNNVLGGCEIAFVGPMKMTEAGERKWADVLDMDIEIRTAPPTDPSGRLNQWAVVDADHEDEDTAIRRAERAYRFFKTCAGFCSEEKWNKWFKD